jgi:hypothetical protein
MKKNIILNKYGIPTAILYHNIIDNTKYYDIIIRLNKELINIIKNKN